MQSKYQSTITEIKKAISILGCNFVRERSLRRLCRETVKRGYTDIHIKNNFYAALQNENNPKYSGDVDLHKHIKMYKKMLHDQEGFKEYIQGKSIAIVGSAPNEIGKGKGAEIDAHDIVMRFNSYSTKGYEEDYGSKTQIYCRGAISLAECPLRDFSHYDYVLSYFSYRTTISPDIMIYLEYLYNLNKRSFFFDTYVGNLHKNICQFAGRSCGPISTGLVTICYIIDLLGSKKNVDLYGFQFDYTNGQHYYLPENTFQQTVNPEQSEHSWQVEKAYLSHFLSLFT